MSDTKVVIIVVVVVAITAEALNSLKEVVGDVGSAGDESVPGGPLPHLRVICFALIALIPFGVFAVLELIVQRQEAEPIISSDSFQP